jgi:hypothetical protein
MFTSIDGLVAQLFLNSQQLVVLGKTLRSARSTGLDLASAKTNNQVGNKSVFSLSGSVRDHDTPFVRESQVGRFDRLGDGSDLVHLQEQTVASFLLNGGLDTLGVGDGQVITNNLDRDGRSQVLVRFPCFYGRVSAYSFVRFKKRHTVILIERIFDRDNRVFLNKGAVQVGQLDTRQSLGSIGVGVLKVQVVFAILVKLGCSDIHGNLDFSSVASRLDGNFEKLKTFLVILDVGSETTLVTNIGG